MDIVSKQGEFPLVKLSTKLLRIIRFWNDSPGQRIPSFGLLVTAIYPLIWLIPSWLFLVSSQDNITRFMKAANELIVFSLIFCKLCFYAIHFRRWEKLFYDLQRSFSSVLNNPSLEIQTILGHVTKSTHNLTKYYCSTVSFNCAAYGLFPMLFIVVKYAVTGSYDVPLSTPIEANYFIPGLRTNFWVWLPVNITLSAMLELHGFALFFVETFTWNLVYATSCLFRILQIQANELSHQCRNEKEWNGKLKTFIALHDSVLRSAETLEEILSLQMLLLYLSTILALCLGMVVLSLAVNEVYVLLTTMAVFGYCIFQTFSFSYLGTELIEQSEAVADAIFHSKWYTQKLNRQKDMCFLMMRAKRPVKLTAAKLFVVTRDSFTQVIKQAYTIFALMSQVLDDTMG
ncbi:AGAP004357-PA [Anopheles gambiae str. PEST]|uniref:AGAP004357-PA n=1 Tax=Anopheles gambiae TaxID=7165 RepID=Q7PQA7_ANOGA|nr:AGAP004357-PA [Anopheles gambiae str. PEST]